MKDNPLIWTGIINSSWAMNLFSKSMVTHKFVNYDLIKGILDKTHDIDLFVKTLKEDVDLSIEPDVNVLNQQYNDYKNKMHDFLTYQFNIRKNREDNDGYDVIGGILKKSLADRLKHALDEEDYIQAAKLQEEIKNLNQETI